MNVFNHPPRTICVLRTVDGTPVALAVSQTHWREWAGAFSIWIPEGNHP